VAKSDFPEGFGRRNRVAFPAPLIDDAEHLACTDTEAHPVGNKIASVSKAVTMSARIAPPVNVVGRKVSSTSAFVARESASLPRNEVTSADAARIVPALARKLSRTLAWSSMARTDAS
jgi:hypothetical protein